ncbi:MAG: aminotransferase class I/II-fold pyridoxal phosphate-dependent enzyme [Planctomycetes bacterium]|nr:aminotransferase class I/II-fold pyridoxal phosphate-dependent enzyme [Planctomycetota bacterium]MBI3843855.1 aminotransferase class I/II-fold pyridoxal phosphate-dependent enzyme [Planctomycetota bacterium]
MSARNPKGFNTKAVHVGSPTGDAGSITSPIAQTSTFRFPNVEAMADVGLGRRAGDFYTRYGTTNHHVVEEKVAALEGAEAGLLFGSGMAAISTALFPFVRPGDEIVSMPDLYGGTLALFHTVLAPLQITTRFVDGSRADAVAAAIGPKTKLIYLESPTNPLLRLADVEAICKVARSRKIITVLDSTFASPLNQSGPALGVDITVHSATKYLGGHHDVTAGVALGSRERMAALLPYRKFLGGVHEPIASWLLERSVKTLGLRVRQQNETTLALARALEGHPKVQKVFYPGLESHPQHALARRQMPRGFGGVLSLQIEGGVAGASRVANRLQLAAIAPSLGGVQTTVSLPIYTSHAGLSPEERRQAGIDDGLLRVAVGIEDAEDLIADFEQALAG